MNTNGYIKARRGMVIIVDECVLTDAAIFAAMQKYKKDLEVGRIMMDSCSMLLERMDVPDCTFVDPDSRLHNWKDFIQNPARPGRQIKKQRAPKQSFRAQMRSVNRNR